MVPSTFDAVIEAPIARFDIRDTYPRLVSLFRKLDLRSPTPALPSETEPPRTRLPTSASDQLRKLAGLPTASNLSASR